MSEKINIPLILVDGEYVKAPVESDPTDVFGDKPTFSDEHNLAEEGFTTRHDKLSRALGRAIPPVVEWRSEQAISHLGNTPDGPNWSA